MAEDIQTTLEVARFKMAAFDAGVSLPNSVPDELSL